MTRECGFPIRTPLSFTYILTLLKKSVRVTNPNFKTW